MKYAIVLISLFLSCAYISPGLFSGENIYGNTIVKEVTSVTTGSRFRVNIKDYPKIAGEDMPIYIYGVNTATIRGTKGPVRNIAIRAKEFTEKELLNAKLIQLRNMQRGMYFVIVADVYVDGKNLARKLIRSGLGKEYYGGQKPSWP